MKRWISSVALAACFFADSVQAETGYDAWLRYAPSSAQAVQEQRASLPAAVVVLGDSEQVLAARDELIRGVQGMLGRTERVETNLPPEKAIILGTAAAMARALPNFKIPPALKADGYWLGTVRDGGNTRLVITSLSESGVVYGVFALLRKLALGESPDSPDVLENPSAPLRWVNEWDNLDGSIERGYAGASIFFEKCNVVADLRRARDYARMLASVGINGCAINNVNADTRVITDDFLPQLARLAAAFRPWGVRLAVSIDFSSPKKIGGLDTFDPLDPRVADWWGERVGALYRAIPDLGGFVLKADSEGRLGPSAYGRTHADAANVVARALKPHGGVLFYRGFVYDHHMDWRDLKNDRARAAYDNFQALDGRFDDNVILQIKHGPIDFQVREPVSPLFGALERTSEAIELQVTQEYTGQQRHLCYLVPMWKEALDFDLHAAAAPSAVKDLISGRTFHRPTGGLVAVVNVGRDTNWLGHPLALANLYGFGRLAWNPSLSAQRIADEWTRLTFGDDSAVVDTIVDIQLKSWRIYEDYTGPLGAGTLTDIIGIHFGPAIESSERNGWGQWHRADERGIGMDRTVATGTGFIGQYRPPVAAQYESVNSCPDALLLFMHHVPYTHVLHSGRTVIQYIYDSHYRGAEEAEDLVTRWRTLQGRIDEPRYEETLRRLEYQAGHAEVWRDAVCNWFLRVSGIPDERGRAGHFPNRIEAESMDLEGYAVAEITPWEAASGGKYIRCSAPDRRGSARFHYAGAPGWRNVSVRYFDQNNGESKFKLFVAGQLVDQWVADDHLPSSKPDAHSSTRRVVTGLALRTGDEIRIEAVADGGEAAGIDYVEITKFAEN